MLPNSEYPLAIILVFDSTRIFIARNRPDRNHFQSYTWEHLTFYGLDLTLRNMGGTLSSWEDGEPPPHKLLEGPSRVGMLYCIGAVLLPRELEQYGDPECRSIPIPEGQAAIHGVRLSAVSQATHGTEVAPVQQDVVERTQHRPRDQIAREGEHATGGVQSAIAPPWFCD